jgi:hypothetical protein
MSLVQKGMRSARLALPRLQRRVRSIQVSSTALILSLDETFICFMCNAQIEEQRPWLFENQPSLRVGSTHHWSHTLVLLPARTIPQPPAPSVLEERLTRVEAKLDERATEHAVFAEDMNARMGRLETLLAQLVGGLGALARTATF